VLSRLARIVALSLPLLLVAVIVSAGHWRIHDGRVERVIHVADVTPAAVPAQTAPPVDQTTFLHHLSPSVPWQVWAALVLLCLLPAVASMRAWSGARRARDTAFSTFSG
jgi:hypothetical protein